MIQTSQCIVFYHVLNNNPGPSVQGWYSNLCKEGCHSGEQMVVQDIVRIEYLSCIHCMKTNKNMCTIIINALTPLLEYFLTLG